MLVLPLACARAVDCAETPPGPGETVECAVGERSYHAHLPASGAGPYPVVFAFHGGGGSGAGMNRSTCPDGDEADPGCLSAVADREGFVVVYPEGTGGRLFPDLRTWNAGGGVGDWQCVSGRACDEGVDDVAFFDAVLADLGRWTAVDPARVYATGMSNGAAMAWRLACERAEVLAAVAPVAGADQYGAAQGCAATTPVPVMQVHGTEDPCWPFDGGVAGCLQDDGKTKTGVEDSLARAAARAGCGDEVVTEALPDLTDDGTTSRYERRQGCAAAVELLRIEGGGHTWPDGQAYLREKRIGRVEQDFPGNEAIWDFFARQAR